MFHKPVVRIISCIKLRVSVWWCSPNCICIMKDLVLLCSKKQGDGKIWLASNDTQLISYSEQPSYFWTKSTRCLQDKVDGIRCDYFHSFQNWLHIKEREMKLHCREYGKI